ncbi:MAG: dTMP kinase [Sphingomicrobium sp.]
MKRGKFISLEGGEGVGKSTQAKALGEALGERGMDCLVTREPGGSAGAEAIRALLLDGGAEWTAEAEALLFAAARADHVAKTIVPALAAGRWVLSDRFLDSSLAYQGGAGGLGADPVRAINDFGCAGVIPDRTLVLVTEAGAERARVRDSGKADAIGGRDAEYHASVASAFRQLAKDEAGRVRLVDASGSADEVTARLLAELADML